MSWQISYCFVIVLKVCWSPMRLVSPMRPLPALPLLCQSYSTVLTVNSMHSLLRHWCDSKVMSVWTYWLCWLMDHSLSSTQLGKSYFTIIHSRMLVRLINDKFKQESWIGRAMFVLFFCALSAGVSLRARYQVNWLVVRTILCAWFNYLEEDFLELEVQFKLGLPSCENHLPSCCKH